MAKVLKVLCGACDLFVKVSKDGVGECRLHPPTLNQETQMWEFPAVKKGSFCGDGRKTSSPTGNGEEG